MALGRIAVIPNVIHSLCLPIEFGRMAVAKAELIGKCLLHVSSLLPSSYAIGYVYVKK